MDISAFITNNMDAILVEWEAFASTFGAVADKMSSKELRDHARQILEYIALDIRLHESAEETEQKSKGLSEREADAESASSIHGRLRHASGFSLLQLIAEYRALRASVLQLWGAQSCEASHVTTKDMMRFNESIDQSLAEAAVAYSDKANQTRDTFLAVLGHDLRSPLAATAMAGTLLARDGVGDSQTRQIGMRVKRSAATMNCMVNDLLELARTQLGDGIPIERHHGDLLEVCQWAVDDASGAHPQSQFVLESAGDLTGSFDHPRLQQVFTNLLNNAAQYGARNVPVVINATGHVDRICIAVTNLGPAIPHESLATLFSSFVQLSPHADDMRPRTSLGLGLYIAREICSAHDGTLTVHSDDSGTVFSACIPRE